MIGPETSDVISGTLAAAAAHGLPIERLERAALLERFPQHAGIAVDHVGVWDPEAGLAFPEHAVVAAVDAARSAGAEIFTDTRVIDIELLDGGARVATATRDFVVRQVVVTTGPWLGKLVPELPLDPHRTPMTWFDEREGADHPHGIEEFPTFIRAMDDDQWLWGHGSGDGFGIKIGPEDDPNFGPVDPDTVDRYVSARDWELVSDLVGRAFPGIDPVPARTTTCMITRSPDGQFQIGRPHHDPRLIVGGGGSVHAFKHAAGIGELIAQIATGEPTLVPTDFVDPNRFLSSGMR
jgi:sarcosine oxidase